MTLLETQAPQAVAERVLIVEDDTAARVGLEQLVKSWGFVADSATRSAPSSTGRHRYGEANVLSTMYRAPNRWARERARRQKGQPAGRFFCPRPLRASNATGLPRCDIHDRRCDHRIAQASRSRVRLLSGNFDPPGITGRSGGRFSMRRLHKLGAVGAATLLLEGVDVRR